MTRDVGHPQEAVESAWQGARAYASHAAAGGAPPSIGVTGIILEPGETAAFMTSARYERFYGTDVGYTSTSMVAFGRPAFVVGSLVGSAALNARRRRSATRAAAAAWRDGQEAGVLATDRRLMVNTAGHGWLSFWYSGIQEYYPSPVEWTVTMVWPDAAPLRLCGLSAPYISVHVASHVLPDDWAAWPEMEALLR